MTEINYNNLLLIYHISRQTISIPRLTHHEILQSNIVIIFIGSSFYPPLLFTYMIAESHLQWSLLGQLASHQFQTKWMERIRVNDHQQSLEILLG